MSLWWGDRYLEASIRGTTAVEKGSLHHISLGHHKDRMTNFSS